MPASEPHNTLESAVNIERAGRRAVRIAVAEHLNAGRSIVVAKGSKIYEIIKNDTGMQERVIGEVGSEPVKVTQRVFRFRHGKVG